MPWRSEGSNGAQPGERRSVSAELRRAARISAAALIATAIVIAVLAVIDDGPTRWVREVLQPLLVLAVLFWFFRQNIKRMSALEQSNARLSDAAFEAEESRARAEGYAHQKASLAAVLDAALGSSPVGFAFFDPQLRFLRVNDTLATMNGMAPADHIGLTLFDVDPVVAAKVEPRLHHVLATRQPLSNIEYRTTTAGSRGERRQLLSSYYPITMPDGSLFGIGVAVMDVTEMKQLEEQLLQAQKMEAVGRLAGGVAHDFNNFLTVISSYAELIQLDPAMQKSEELREIRGAAARAAALTRQLLAFSRRSPMEPRIVNPNDILRGIEGLLRRLIDPGVTVEWSLSPDTPLIRVDPGQLEQVVMNLVINASDAMPDGGRMTIEARGVQLRDEFRKRQPDLLPGTYAMIRVRDTGHGMDESTRSQIFEPFFTTKEEGRGTGLGLSTVYGIVKQSNGTVLVDSAPGAGSVFTIYLPAVGDTEPQ